MYLKRGKKNTEKKSTAWRNKESEKTPDSPADTFAQNPLNRALLDPESSFLFDSNIK